MTLWTTSSSVKPCASGPNRMYSDPDLEMTQDDYLKQKVDNIVPRHDETDDQARQAQLLQHGRNE